MSSPASPRRARVISVVGTRPEAIKMAPIIKELDGHRTAVESVVVCTAQHREMLDQVLSVFGIRPTYDLNIMRSNQSLPHVTIRAIEGMDRLLRRAAPDLLLVQGDTTTTFAASLAAFYHRIPVGHVEAGLRSYDNLNPYPEELNRKLTTALTDYHFAPTTLARDNLLREGVSADRIFVTGNTVVDALLMMVKDDFRFQGKSLSRIDFRRRRMILITSHRRENWGEPLQNICAAVIEIVRKYEEVSVVYPVHLNPNVQRTVKAALRGLPQVHLIEPLDYVSFVNLMKRAYLILTDSGGIQEEAPSLGKPVLVLRTVIERPEASHAGLAKVIGTEVEDIVANVSRLLDDERVYSAMSRKAKPYGDGRAAKRIVAAILRLLGAR